MAYSCSTRPSLKRGEVINSTIPDFKETRNTISTGYKSVVMYVPAGFTVVWDREMQVLKSGRTEVLGGTELLKFQYKKNYF